MGTTPLGISLWLLVSAVIAFGFYIGDTAPSDDWIREDFGGARDEVAGAGEATVGLPPSVQLIMLPGLAVMERIALWAHATDGTLLGDGIECLALVTTAVKPAAALAEVAR
jgi:hypothetical protein